MTFYTQLFNVNFSLLGVQTFCRANVGQYSLGIMQSQHAGHDRHPSRLQLEHQKNLPHSRLRAPFHIVRRLLDDALARLCCERTQGVKRLLRHYFHGTQAQSGGARSG